MITLAADCLVFKLANGENVPFSSDMVSVDLMGETSKWFDVEFVRDATKAVFYYFKHEQGRETVTVGEFTQALERVLQGFAAAADLPVGSGAQDAVIESDLARLARESSECWELVFFPRLRQEVRLHAQKNPRLLRFNGLRDCVKQLVGAQRWGDRCRVVEEQIVCYIRECLTAESKPGSCSLMVR